MDELIDSAPWPVNDSDAMDLDDLFPDKPGDPLTLLTREDLDPLSIEELHERIAKLKEEIARIGAHIERVNRDRSAAEELFKR
jgi:uncharacterized small protein (DUF1192 family)